MRLSEIFSGVKEVAVDIGDGKFFNIAYKPQMITPEALAKFGALQNVGPESANLGIEQLALITDISDALITMISQCVASWDLTYNDDTPIPLTPDHLRNVPLSILALTLSAMKLDAKPNPTTGSNSPATSLQKAG